MQKATSSVFLVLVLGVVLFLGLLAFGSEAVIATEQRETTSAYVYLPIMEKPVPVETPEPPPQPAVQIVNGGFEQAFVGWWQHSENDFNLIVHRDDLPVAPHNGAWASWLGGSYNEVSVLEQFVVISADKYMLKYWVWVASYDVCGDGYDVGGLFVDDIAVDAYYLCSPNNTNGWVPRTINLSSFVGKRVPITFFAYADGSLNSNMFVDDVGLHGSSLLGADHVFQYIPDQPQQADRNSAKDFTVDSIKGSEYEPKTIGSD